MQNIRTKIRRGLYYLRHNIFSRDHAFLIGIAVACLFFVASAISAMSRNWELEQRLNEKKTELALTQLEVETAELENLYYHSEEYQELSARQHLNKELPGEHLVYLAENSAAAKAKHETREEETTAAATPSNLSQWLSFLFGI